jgi:hypothetical protein
MVHGGSNQNGWKNGVGSLIPGSDGVKELGERGFDEDLIVGGCGDSLTHQMAALKYPRRGPR